MPHTSILSPQLGESREQNGSAVETARERILSRIQETVARKQQKKTVMSQVVDLHPKLKRETDGQRVSTAVVHANIQQPTSPEIKESVISAEALDRILAKHFEIPAHQQRALEERAFKYDVRLELLETVYRRGMAYWENGMKRTQSQYAFDRVNSFLHNGLARQLDADLAEQAPVNKRFIGTNDLTATYQKDTPGQEKIDRIKKQIKQIKENTSDRWNPRIKKALMPHTKIEVPPEEVEKWTGTKKPFLKTVKDKKVEKK